MVSRATYRNAAVDGAGAFVTSSGRTVVGLVV
jgi:hypothetical protein